MSEIDKLRSEVTELRKLLNQCMGKIDALEQARSPGRIKQVLDGFYMGKDGRVARR